MQQIEFCQATESGVSLGNVNTYLNQGYKIVSVTAQHCAITGGNSYSYKAFGGFVVVLEKED